ncbi:MAG: riboflavin synthase [Proteobacteria bacterium]|nr:riboflavin synthase [Pseudomonadota bacterium]TDJ34445.1 MAG: riboflavin synthase [Gammaproteobacteria bacterium]
MFTGIIKAVGKVAKMEQQGGDLRLTITSADLPWKEFAVGESISINGVCLTAVEFLSNGFVADVSAETTKVTALANLAEGSKLNLEPSVALGERLGGHLVSGHVDCVGKIKTRETDARSVRLVVGIPAGYNRYIARKGAICIDGVSLTVNEVSDNTFSVNIIPHTADVTIIGDYRTGTEVNIEVDLLARYVERLLADGDDSAISEKYLRAHGYA